MSIRETLDRLEDEGKLVRYLPPVGWPLARQLYLSHHLYSEMRNHRSSLNFFGQMVPVRVMFERWTSGETVSVRLGREGGGELARLEPPPEEIWEFRITQAEPQVRVFGRFVEPDVFVALLARNRDALGGAIARGNTQTKAWSEAMYGCLSEWNRLFGGAPAFRATAVGSYVTANCARSE